LHTAVKPFIFKKKSTDPLIILNNSTKKPKTNKITNRSLDHLATTINTSMSRRYAAIFASPSPEPDKACYSRACCSRPKWKVIVLRPQRTSTPNIADNENRRSDTDLKPRKRS
jgi:hypothetical protein